MTQPTQESLYLIKKARGVTEPYLKVPGMVAAMITGSAAKGLADEYSDIDMTMYWQVLPDDETLVAIRKAHGAPERVWFIGDPSEGSLAEAYHLNGIEVQIGHTTVAAWEEAIDSVLVQLECATPTQKALEGTLNCIPFYGEDAIKHWQEKIANYPDALSRAMIEQHMTIMPVWGLQHHFDTRDANLWLGQLFSEASFKIVAMLAGLNQLYFTDFQFKRTRYFIDQMTRKPGNLAERLESLLAGDIRERSETLRQLVRETASLVNEHYPDINTQPLTRRLDWTQPRWKAPETR